MRELFINYSDSTKTSLVFTTEEGDEFFVAVTEEMRSIVDGSSDSGSHNGLSSVSHLTPAAISDDPRSEEHTSELQSRGLLVFRLLLEKKKYENNRVMIHRRDIRNLGN